MPPASPATRAHAGAVVKKLAPGVPGKPRDAWLRIAYGKTGLRRTVRQAGGTWDAARGLWRLPASVVKQSACKAASWKAPGYGNPPHSEIWPRRHGHL